MTSPWPTPERLPYCRIYNDEVREQPGFYDPPDIHTTPKRTKRIASEYPEIHAWADQISSDWHDKEFRELKSPARRNRIVAAMMLESHRATPSEDDARLLGIKPYLLVLRAETVERTVGWVVKIANGVAQLLAWVAGAGGALGSAGSVGAKIVSEISAAVEVLGRLALAAEAGELDDVDAAAGAAAEILDALSEIVDLTPGDFDDEVLLEIAKRVGQGASVATALAAALDEAS